MFYYISAPNAIITFHLISSSPAIGHDLFKVDQNSGLVLTKSFLDESTRNCYTLLVEARNQYQNGPILTDNATVYICVTDQNGGPSFDQSFYEFDINENEPAGIIRNN